MAETSIFDRAGRLLNFKDYEKWLPPYDCGNLSLQPPRDRQYVLRMMVKGLYGEIIRIPEELKWLRDMIMTCCEIQLSKGVDHPFIYVTVRHGWVTSVTDDVWHVDGFSMRVPHLPEQNYIWSTAKGTEILKQPFFIPAAFDPYKHNIHHYFQDHANDYNIQQLPTNKMFAIDPYIVHRRPSEIHGHRTFVRISFVPVEIEDDTCEMNPLMPARRYNREDVRNILKRF